MLRHLDDQKVDEQVWSILSFERVEDEKIDSEVWYIRKTIPLLICLEAEREISYLPNQK